VITIQEYLMGRQLEYPLTIELALNACELLAGVNYLRGVYGRPLVPSSGYRPGHYNKKAGGAKQSSHLSCEAIDIRDPLGEFAKWCLSHLKELERAGLYLEDPSRTKGWTHLQTRPPQSGRRVFSP
jgi:hypothetical protein